MTENKQFIIPDYPDCIKDTVNNKEYPMSSYYPHIEGICELLNKLNDEKKQLQEKLKIYHKIANCTNCNYHNYDWFDDGSYDEFEVCRKGNDVTEGICEEWREL